jgi:hypothetical protein
MAETPALLIRIPEVALRDEFFCAMTETPSR